MITLVVFASMPAREFGPLFSSSTTQCTISLVCCSGSVCRAWPGRSAATRCGSLFTAVDSHLAQPKTPHRYARPIGSHPWPPPREMAQWHHPLDPSLCCGNWVSCGDATWHRPSHTKVKGHVRNRLARPELLIGNRHLRVHDSPRRAASPKATRKLLAPDSKIEEGGSIAWTCVCSVSC